MSLKRTTTRLRSTLHILDPNMEFSGIVQPAMSHLSEGITPKMTGAWNTNLALPKTKVHPWKFNSLPWKKTQLPVFKRYHLQKGGAVFHSRGWSCCSKVKGFKRENSTQKHREVDTKPWFLPMFSKETNAMQSNQSMFCTAMEFWGFDVWPMPAPCFSTLTHTPRKPRWQQKNHLQ